MLELVVAMALAGAVVAGVFAVMDSSRSAFLMQSETGDVQQRLRVASGTLARDIVMAGAGADSGPLAGSLLSVLAPVLPYRRGAVRNDPPGSYRADTITLMFVPSPVAGTTLAADFMIGSEVLTSDNDAGCPPAQAACGLKSGDTILVHDGTGRFDTLSVKAVLGGEELSVTASPGMAGRAYPAGSSVTRVTSRTYALKNDATGTFTQLVAYDDGPGSDVPVVDHVVVLRFDYFGDPLPPLVLESPDKIPDDSPGDSPAPTTTDGPGIAPRGRTTYGPVPPPWNEQPTSYPAGENCVFSMDTATRARLPRLLPLAADASRGSLVPLGGAMLADGPWCPDEGDPNRFDADLLRIRRVGVTLRVEAGTDSLRAASGTLFFRAGTSRGVHAVPDQEIHFEISPRNLGWQQWPRSRASFTPLEEGTR